MSDRRGRPRDPRTRSAILAAARALLDEGGLSAVTMEGVAQRAGVGKPTVYRYWPNASAVAMAAFLDGAKPTLAPVATGDPLTALRRQLAGIAATFAARTGRMVKAMIAASIGETELEKAFRHQFIAQSRDEGRRLLMAAQELGQVRDDIDAETTLDQIYGPLYFRLLTGHAPLDAAFTEALLDQVLAGIGTP